MMNVIISAESLKYPLTGIGRYVWELLLQLKIAPELDDLLYFKQLRLLPECDLPQECAGKPKPLIEWLKKQSWLTTSVLKAKPWLEGKRLRGYEDYIFHGPNFYLPQTQLRTVATFHDVSVFDCPQYHPQERVRFMQKALVASVARSHRIITISEYTRQQVMRLFNYPAERVHTVPLACNAAFKPYPASDSAALMHRLGLKFKEYALYVGTIEPRKNINVLLDAYSLLPQRLRKQYPLVLCGYQGWNSADLHLRIQQGMTEGWLHYLGYLPKDELPILYSAARVFLFPTHYEGFGLPLIEAMAAGVPVICSNTTSLPEVVGAAALTAAPEDTDAFVAHLQRALEDEAWIIDAQQAGIARAQLFSWQRCAAETIDVYRQLQ